MSDKLQIALEKMKKLCPGQVVEHVTVVEKIKEDKEVEDYSNPPCSNCGSDKMIRSGTCFVCICGTTSGCS